MQGTSSQTSHLRHIGNVKPLSAERSDIGLLFHSNSVLYFGFFKQISTNFLSFFKRQEKIRSIYITNDKKSRLDSNIYFVKISSKELIYEEESESKLLRFVYQFEKDDVLINNSVVYNPQTKQKLMNKLQGVGQDIQNNQAFIFES
jgi:hypothetical protein